jgi:hypothetical protein
MKRINTIRYFSISILYIILQIQYLMTIRAVGAEVFHGQTDMTKLIVVSCNSVNAPKNTR